MTSQIISVVADVMSQGLFGSQTARIPAFPWGKCKESWQASTEGLKSSGQNVPLEAEAAFCTLPLCLRALDSGWGIPEPQHFLPLNSCPQMYFFFTPTQPPCRPPMHSTKEPQAGVPASQLSSTRSPSITQHGHREGEGVCIWEY